jgi:hypothetical protein
MQNTENTPTENLAESQLAHWLSHPGAEIYLGKHTMLKIDCLAFVLGQPGSLASIARRYGVTRQAAHNHARAAREVFGVVNG